MVARLKDKHFAILAAFRSGSGHNLPREAGALIVASVHHWVDGQGVVFDEKTPPGKSLDTEPEFKDLVSWEVISNGPNHQFGNVYYTQPFTHWNIPG